MELHQEMSGESDGRRQEGIALLMALIALLLFSLLSLYLCLIATAEVKVSDNFESSRRARSAALAGLSHARALLRGIRFDDLLRGPDGKTSSDPAYLASAKTYEYRMPVAWAVARLLDIRDPSGALAVAPDDGIFNTGWHPGGDGIVLIPPTGMDHTTVNPNGPGLLTTARYFVKVSDNNGEAGELSRDPADDPFTDGDGQIILRSMGIARTVGEGLSAGVRSNSAAVFEVRFRRPSTWDLEAALTVQADAVQPSAGSMFSGLGFLIGGGPVAPGIAVAAASSVNGAVPVEQVRAALSPAQAGCVLGAGAIPSVADITAALASDPDKRLRLDVSAVWRFLRETAPQYADGKYAGAQAWLGSAPGPLGRYDPLLSPASPNQDPRWTFVDGDLLVDGELEGAGLLLVSGKVTIRGNFVFRGLVMALGAGELDVGGRATVSGGMFVAGIGGAGGDAVWTTARIRVADDCRLLFDRGLIRMALNLIPPVQISLREIAGIPDT